MAEQEPSVPPAENTAQVNPPAADPPPAEPAPADAGAPTSTAVVDHPADDTSGGELDKATIDELLKQASFEDPSQAVAPETASSSTHVPETSDLKLPNFNQVMQDAQVSSVDLLRDVELNVKIELGRSRMLVEDVLKLAEGSVVELDKLAGDPVDVFVNERLVARGEVLVLNDSFCVRINEIVAGTKEEGL